MALSLSYCMPRASEYILAPTLDNIGEICLSSVLLVTDIHGFGMKALLPILTANVLIHHSPSALM
jgi:hypothetical protein